MPKFILHIALFALLFISYNGYTQTDQAFFIKTKGDFKQIDKFKKLPGIKSISSPFKLKEMQTTYRVVFSNATAQKRLSEYLITNDWIEYIEPVPTYQLFYTPNDLNASQYNLTITSAELAWDIDNNASDITIAIIDDAVDLNHSDLSANITFNPLEIPNNGIDDDANGYIDDWNGWDFADNDNNPNPPNTSLGHGTHVAGIAAAVNDNGNGIAAIGANAKILPVKIGADANGALSNVIQAVEYAVLMEADVINMSWGGGPYSTTFQNLLNIAYNQGIVVVAAAGNSNTNLPMYPAAYNHVISVASTNQTDAKSSFSNYGNTIDLAAPGSDIYSCVPFSNYATNSGTSMAAPYVAGLAALMRSSSPFATVDQIETCLESTCDPVNGTFSNQVGAGRVNAYEAMQCITFPDAMFGSNFTQVCPGGTVNYTDQSNGLGLTYNWTFAGGTPANSTLQNPTVTYSTSGNYTTTLQVSDGVNSDTYSITNYITVAQPSATISGFSTINQGGFGSVSLSFTGNPPYNITITDGTNTYPITGITTSPYTYFFNPVATTNYSITQFNDALCSGTYTGTATIDVVSGTTGSCIDSLSTFVKYLGTNLEDYGMAIQDLGEYGFLIMGRQVVSSGNYRNYICRLDKCGVVSWEKLYNPNTWGIPVAATMDGQEILISGYYGAAGNNTSRTYLLRIDLSGNIINGQRFGGNTTYPRQMIKTTNNELVFSGVTNNLGAGANDIYIARSTITGTLLWQKAYGGFANDFGHNIMEDDNGDLLAIGYSRNYTSNLYKGKIMKTDANGVELWTKEYHPGSNRTVFTDIDVYQNFYYVSAQTNGSSFGDYDQLILKLDLNGNIIWSKKVGGNAFDSATGIRVRNDTVYVQGISASGTTSREITIARMTTTGNLIDYTALGTPNDDKGFGGATTFLLGNNQGIYGIGSGNGGYIGQDDILFYKLNHYSDLCAPINVTLSEANIVMTTEVFSTTTTNAPWQFNNQVYTATNVISNQGYICDSLAFIDSSACNITADFSPTISNCYLDSTFFTDQSSANVNIYHYDFGDGSPPLMTSDTSTSYLYSTPGNYNVQLIAIDTLNGCSDTISHLINVTANPNIELNDTLLTCINDTVMLSADLSCISNQANIDWYPASLITYNNGTSAKAVLNASGYIFIEVNDGGNITIDSVYIVVDTTCCTSYPQIEFDANSNFCENGTINLINTSISSSGTPSYTWDFLPDGIPLNYIGTTPPGLSFATPGQKNIILTMNDACGAFTDTFSIAIYEPPIFNAGNDTILCESATITIGEAAIAGWNYLWTDGNLVSDSLAANPSIYVNDDITIYVEVEDSWTGCKYIDSIRFDFDSVSVNILMSDTLMCTDNQNQIDIYYDVYPSGSTPVWTPNHLITNTNSNSISVTFENEATIQAAIQSNSGICTSADTVTIQIIAPVLPILIDTVICDDDVYYYYPDRDWESLGQTVNKIEITEPGTYYFHESNVCNIVQHQFEIGTKDCNCYVYIPNAFTPDNNNYNNAFKAEVICDLAYYRLDIYNRWGELLYTSQDPNSEWNGVYDGTPVQSGVYIWKLTYQDIYSSERKHKQGHVTLLR